MQDFEALAKNSILSLVAIEEYPKRIEFVKNLNHHNLLVVEEEFHVCFKRVKFEALRNEYLITWYHSGDSLQKFHNIISTNNSVLIKRMCTNINEFLKLKNSQLL